MAEHYKGNPDSAGLGWYGDDRILIGCVDEVNGLGSEEISGFVPTRNELIQLVKYWATEEIHIEFYWFVCQQTGSSEIRRGAFAERRVSRIAEVLGEEVVAKAVQEAYKEYGKNVDRKTWRVFLKGTPEEKRAFQDQMETGFDAEEVED